MKRRHPEKLGIVELLALEAAVDNLVEQARRAGVPNRAITIALLGSTRSAAMHEFKSPSAFAWWLRSVADGEELGDDLAASARGKRQ